MQWSLVLLILMGHCLFFVCPLRVYRFIETQKNWQEAQRYCRDTYTDLATVYDMKDIQRLNGSVNTEAWIGLYNDQGRDNRMWHWSLPGVEVTRYFWGQNQPYDIYDNCVVIDYDKWYNHRCSHKHAFICYDDKKPSNEQYIFHNGKKTWSEAQKYCREEHTDLVSGLDQLRDKQLRSEIQKRKYWWIGLFRDSWRWSDGSNVSFTNWKSFQDDNSKKCAVTLPKSGKWDSRPCGGSKPFFCYKEENMILIKQRKTWEEASQYCRENHHDLVSITDSSQQRWAEEKAKVADTEFVWLGMRYTCVLDLWFWVNDELVGYKNWAQGKEPAVECYWAVAMDKRQKHKWHAKADNDKFNFICALH